MNALVKPARPRSQSRRRSRRCQRADDSQIYRRRESRDHPAVPWRRGQEALGDARRRRDQGSLPGDVVARRGAGRQSSKRWSSSSCRSSRARARSWARYEQTQRMLNAFLPKEKVDSADGGNPRPRRPQHLGQARQRQRSRAGELSEERIPANRRRGAGQGAPRTRRQGAGRTAGGFRRRMRAAHAGDGAGAARNSGKDRDHAAHRIHVQPGAHLQARQPRNDGRDLQQFRPPDRSRDSSTALEERNREAPTASAR